MNPLGVGSRLVSFELVGNHPKPENSEFLAYGLKRKVNIGQLNGKDGASIVSKVTALVPDRCIKWSQIEGKVPEGHPFFEVRALPSERRGVGGALWKPFGGGAGA